MLKRFLILFVVTISMVSLSFGNNSPATEAKDITVPVQKKDDKKGPNKHMPSMAMPVSISLSRGCVCFIFPFEGYPMQIDIEMESEPYGVWSTTLMDTQSFLDSFDGYSGDYKLTVTTANGSSYVGYFTLE